MKNINTIGLSQQRTGTVEILLESQALGYIDLIHHKAISHFCKNT